MKRDEGSCGFTSVVARRLAVALQAFSLAFVSKVADSYRESNTDDLTFKNTLIERSPLCPSSCLSFMHLISPLLP